MNNPDRSAEQRDGIRAETTRVVRRWQQLPLDRARSHVPQVHRVVQELADLVAERDGLPLQPVPELGERVVIDQLRVMVHDVLDGPSSPSHLGRAAGLMTDLRRGLP